MRLRSTASATVLVAAVAALSASPAQGTHDLDSLVSFQSPSRNIGCILTNAHARCDVSRRDWSPPPKPASCDLDYGQGTFISRNGSRGRFTCAGDTVLGSGRVLGYGRSIRRGKLKCTSRRSGVTCKNRRGHGFRISRESYRLF